MFIILICHNSQRKVGDAVEHHSTSISRRTERQVIMKRVVQGHAEDEP